MKTLKLSNDFKGATIRFILFLAVMMFLSNMIYANHSSTTPTLSVKFTPMAKNVIIELDNIHSNEINISIRDVSGTKLHDEDFKSIGLFTKKFNLKNLPNGQYQIIVKDTEAIWTQSITIQNDGIETGELFQVYAPHFKVIETEKSLEVNWNANTNYSFNIYDENGNSIYYEGNKVKGAMKKTYRLDALPVGNYSAVLKTDWESFNQDFNLK